MGKYLRFLNFNKERFVLAHHLRGFSIFNQSCCLWAWVGRAGGNTAWYEALRLVGRKHRVKEPGLLFQYTPKSTHQLPSFFHDAPSSHGFWIVPLHWITPSPPCMGIREALRSSINTYHAMMVNVKGGNGRETPANSWEIRNKSPDFWLSVQEKTGAYVSWGLGWILGRSIQFITKIWRGSGSRGHGADRGVQVQDCWKPEGLTNLLLSQTTS